MLVSILHRVTGDGMAIVGGLLFIAWLTTAAIGKDAYDGFLWLLTGFAGGALGYIVGIGLTWSFFEHMLSGLRHFVLDTGAGYELNANKSWSQAIVIAAPILTALVWAYILFGR
ncbi:hypothetical protein NX02_23015 [Sphingomonas sanxanigenens DSM 19645 = NX02]|uniref:Succinate dehydrogenase cytochrome b556 subunit n=2 Tax=Sphingomonas sanxanigenens TaxID=397260 RepID=W0AKL1_9SPHN|nr:hypothetical protein NX02_23015 [Sphingomonas sanxanigenens DSM 19645 = NX02]